MVSERVLAEPDALGDGSADSIYLGDKIVSRSGRAMGRPGGSGRHVVRLEFMDPMCDRSQSDQIGSGPGRSDRQQIRQGDGSPWLAWPPHRSSQIREPERWQMLGELDRI